MCSISYAKWNVAFYYTMNYTFAMCTGAGIVSIRAVRSMIGVEIGRIVGAWWVMGSTA
jgi:hypothetical protein